MANAQWPNIPALTQQTTENCKAQHDNGKRHECERPVEHDPAHADEEHRDEEGARKIALLAGRQLRALRTAMRFETELVEVHTLPDANPAGGTVARIGGVCPTTMRTGMTHHIGEQR